MILSPPYITPRGLLTGAAAREALAAGYARPLGDDAAFSVVERTDGAGAVPQMLRAYDVPAAGEPWLQAYATAPRAFAGLPLRDPILMGVVNVTPDSFSDGGKFQAADAAVAHGRALIADGAAIVDVGGESTRPGAAPASVEDEIARIVPVVRALARDGACVSIDTRHAAVMDAALAAGACIVNDVTALQGEGSLAAVARTDASVMLMHMQGEPRTMQADPTYAWAPGDVFAYLQARIAACLAAGISQDRIAVDPGIGFGKNDTHNAQILDHLALYRALGCAVALGVSRKSFIGRMSRGEDAGARLPGSLAAALHGVAQGARIVRVHDVAETRQALAVAHRLTAGV